LLFSLGFISNAFATSQSAHYRLNETIASAAGNTYSGASSCLYDSLAEPAIGQSFGQQYSVQTGFFNNYFLPKPTPTATIIPTSTMTPVAKIPAVFFKIYHSQINPTRGEQARISWCQPQDGPVSIKIYNLLGDKVATLFENENFKSGEYHEVNWNGRTQKGSLAGSGIYIVQLTAPGNEARNKIALIK
jgi:hypothetical protein